MHSNFKKWVEANKLSIVVGSESNPSRPKYSMLPIVNTVMYDPSNFEPVYVYRMVTKKRYDELIETGDLMYGEGRLLKLGE